MDGDPVTRAGPGRPSRSDADLPDADLPDAADGWFVGPDPDPDRYELVGSGLRGGEGTTWKARYRGELDAPLDVAVKQLRPAAGAGPDCSRTTRSAEKREERESIKRSSLAIRKVSGYKRISRAKKV